MRFVRAELDTKGKSIVTQRRIRSERKMKPQPDVSAGTVALMTPRGRGAVATLRFVGDAGLLNGPDANFFRAADDKLMCDQPIGRICFGYWGAEPSEEVVVCRVDEAVIEIHCHGGEAAARRIVNDLETHGCSCCTWQDLMVEENGVFAAECQEALTRSMTARTAAILLEQATETLQLEIERLRAIDGAKTPAHQNHAQTRAQAFEHRKRRLDELLRWSDFGLHLTKPWSVVLAGPPNVGKSSLINALVGYTRSIVYDQPGTTRDVVTTQTALDGWPVQLSDTAGLRPTTDPMESLGIESARSQFARADCRVLLFDISQPPDDRDRHLMSEWPDALRVAHKCDLPRRWNANLLFEAIPVSSLTGEGITTLLRRITEHLVPEQPKPGTAVPITERQIRLLRQARIALKAENNESFNNLILQCLGR